MEHNRRLRGLKVNTGGTIGALASVAVIAAYLFLYLEPQETPQTQYLFITFLLFGGAFSGHLLWFLFIGKRNK